MNLDKEISEGLNRIINICLDSYERRLYLFHGSRKDQNPKPLDYASATVPLEQGTCATDNLDRAILDAILPEDTRKKHQDLDQGVLRAINPEYEGYIRILPPKNFEKVSDSVYRATKTAAVDAAIKINGLFVKYRLDQKTVEK